MDHHIAVTSVAGSFFRFCMVGTLGFASDAGLLLLLIHMGGAGPLTARVVSITVAVTITWYLNRRWTFGSSSPDRIVEWGRYALTNGVGAAANYAVFSAALLLVPAMGVLLALVLGSAAGLVINYLGSRSLVFTARSAQRV